MHITDRGITLLRPDDWHLHVRDGQALASVVPATARQMGRALIMPNLRPPVTTVQQALDYRARILAAVPQGCDFEPLMSLYLTDNTPADEMAAARQAGIVAIKLYPAGATTNSDAGVTDLRRCYPVFEAMQKHGLLLLLHGEVADPATDIFDRESLFIDRVLIPLRRDFPELKMVFEHLSTSQGVNYVMQADARIAATITPQHLLYNRNHILSGGIRPHLYCLPVLKREEHRQALLAAATCGNPRFFLGTDSAPHARHLKEATCGCAGCYSAPYALELYAQAFEQADALESLEGFASCFGADFYGLPRPTQTITLRRESWTAPQELPFGNATIQPLAAGETLNWKLAGTAG